MSLDTVSTREEAIALLEGYAEERKDELDKGRTRRPLVKTYMLETVRREETMPSLGTVFDMAGHTLTAIDDSLFKVHDNEQGKTVGVLEKMVDRYPVIYTYEDTQAMDPWVKRLVRSSQWLDHLWLSGRAFEQLLEIVIRFSPGHRYGRIVFQHESFFESGEAPNGNEDTDVDESEPGPLFPSEDSPLGGEPDVYVPERRSTRFSVIERLEVLKGILPKMRKLYHPLHAVAQIRFPARGRGGHDFYYYGKATNRSDSFTDHRQHVKFVLGVYKKATEETETAIWVSARKEVPAVAGVRDEVTGAPVLMEFSQQLAQETFDRFIRLTFGRRENRFRLWGNPIVLGPRKVHVYGLDRHLWQPIFLEITDHHIVAIVPQGTCGNSIHRLVTNIQQYLDPAVSVWVGDRSYQDLIRVEPNIGDIYEAG